MHDNSITVTGAPADAPWHKHRRALAQPPKVRVISLPLPAAQLTTCSAVTLPLQLSYRGKNFVPTGPTAAQLFTQPAARLSVRVVAACRTPGSMGLSEFLGFGARCKKPDESSVQGRVDSVTVTKKRMQLSNSRRKADEEQWAKDDEEIAKISAEDAQQEERELQARKISTYNPKAVPGKSAKKSAMKKTSKFGELPADLYGSPPFGFTRLLWQTRSGFLGFLHEFFMNGRHLQPQATLRARQ